MAKGTKAKEERNHRVFELRYGNEYIYPKIARMMHISSERARQIATREANRIRREWENGVSKEDLVRRYNVSREAIENGLVSVGSHYARPPFSKQRSD